VPLPGRIEALANWIIVKSTEGKPGIFMILSTLLQASRVPGYRACVRGFWLALWLGLAASGAQAADCRPASPHPPATAGTGAFDHGLLWKIETAGVAPSHLFGTFHTSDPRITTLPCPVQRVFDSAASFIMEMIMNGAGVTSMAEAMFFSDGNTLQQVLGDALYRETLQALGLDEIPATGGINHMKPWAVMMTLTTPRPGRGLFLDMALQLRATRQNKVTYGLESMQEQIDVFNGMSLDDQVVLLRDTLQSRRLLDGVMEELTRAYLRRDLHGLVKLSEQYRTADTRVHQAMMDRLLTQRNRNMAARLRARLQEGNAFIAVGALHLPGEAGLLQLLRNDGYRVTRVY
jgi:hypothetical protein